MKKPHPWAEDGGHVYPIDLAATLLPKADVGRPVTRPHARCVLCRIKRCEQVMLDESICHQPIHRASLKAYLESQESAS